ncbi:hypothetical protein FRC12_012341 [Ceratobasidium sp. 428]|nr:hypothetical protein FRC12_012341 [Ceratobasidium sp. 428]
MSAPRNTRRVHISNTTTPSELLAQLTARQCPDITKDLDFSSVEELPECRGGFGDIYRAKLRNGQEVAIKCLRVYIKTKEGRQVQRIASHEMYTWSKAEDSNVLKLLGVARLQDQLAMVSPWMSNGDIMAYLARTPKADRCELSAQIAKGLAYLHSVGITHGDVKADNVMICGNGTAKLADFGSAKLKDYTLQFSENLKPRSGTTKFLAPERLRGQGPSAEADVYALGMTILHIISGEPPFKETDRDAIYMTVTTFKRVPPRPLGAIPEDSEHGDTLWSLLLHCWDQEPAARPGAIGAHESMKDITPDGLLSNNPEDSTTTMSWDDDHEPLPPLDALDITDRLVLPLCATQPSFGGHMTEIYRGELDDGSEVAIKCVINTSTPDQSFMRVTREMHAWSKVRHKHVLEFLGAALYRDRFAMVSPWMDNGNLSQYLSGNPDVDRYLMCVQMCKGLVYLHCEGIVHGNLTADNMLVSGDGEVKIADFGSTRLEAYSVLITSESQIGDYKISWTPPELLNTQGCVKSLKTDVYSFGMTMFHVIGSVDATAQNGIRGSIHMIPSKRDELPPEESGITQSEHGTMLWSLLDRCWSSDPETRPEATSIQEELEIIVLKRQKVQPIWQSSAHSGHVDDLLHSTAVTYVIERGCQDLSSALDLERCPQYPIARGGFGDIFEGTLKNGQSVAIKCFRSSFNMVDRNDAHKSLKAIARELYIWSKLEHDHIVPLLGVMEFRGSIGLVSPWMKHGSILEYLKRNPKVDRCSLCIEVAKGIAYLHGVNVVSDLLHPSIRRNNTAGTYMQVHGDLKGREANILVSDTGHAMITDFGTTTLNKYTLKFSSTTTSCAFTARWAAPEILTGERKSSMKSDIYALGMAYQKLQEIITDKPPFAAFHNNIQVIHAVAVRRAIPDRPDEELSHYGVEGGHILWSLLEECWMYDPDLRSTASELIDMLQQVAEYKPSRDA